MDDVEFEQCLSELRGNLTPKQIHTDPSHLSVYNSDASIYSITPKAVITIRSVDDISSSLRVCNKYKIPITARGGGTGLAGGAIGPGIILDFCQYDNKIEINPEDKIATVSAGVIFDDLNIRAAKYRLMFAPNPSSGDSCRIGGMLANNSSGSRTVRYGTTRKYIRSMNIITAVGKMLFIKPLKLGSRELKGFFDSNPEFEEVFNLIIANRGNILPRRRDVKKNSTGYDLWSFLDKYDDGWVDFNKIFIGSEGTLCIFESAELMLEQLPPKLFTVLLFYKRYKDIGGLIPKLLKLKPYSLEMADSNSMDLIGRSKYSLPDDASAMLLLQFDVAELEDIKHRLTGIINPDEVSANPVFEIDPDKQNEIWAARKSLLPTLYKYHPLKKPLPFVEDACLPAEKLPEIFETLDYIFGKYGISYGGYGHIGDGNIHIKPLVDASDATDREKMCLISAEVYNEILRQGGVISGEHADGRVRAPFLRYVYGEEVYSIFKRIKAILDPNDILNPGVKLTSNTDIVADIDIPRLNWDCSQCGKCVPSCPSFEVYGSELYSPRGRVKVSSYPGISTSIKDESLGTCINCKTCRTVCPAGVDASAQSLLFREINKPPLLEPILNILKNSDLLSKIAPNASLALRFIQSSLGRKILESLSKPALKINKDARLPIISREPFASRMKGWSNGENPKVAYFYGCADGLLDNNTADTVVKILERENIPFAIPEQVCCGVPAETYGFKEYAKESAIVNITSLNRFDYVITTCGTCLLMLKDYPHLFNKNDRYYGEAKKLASKVYEITEFLLKFGNNLRTSRESKITYHDSCHLRTAGITSEPRRFIKELGADFVEMDYADRCCGFAGTYYFSHPDKSKDIFAVKKKALADSKAEIVASCCPTCILQFEYQQDFAQSLHPIMLIDNFDENK